MLRTSLRLACVAVVTVVLTTASLGAGTSSAQLNFIFSVQVSHEQSQGQAVQLTVTLLRDNKGVQVAPVGLPTSAFSVRENKVPRPVTTTYLGGENLEVEMVIETERGATDVATIRATANNLLDRLPSGTRIGVIGAGPTPAVLNPLSTDRQRSRAAVAKLSANDGEAVLPAINLALRQFSPRSNVRRTLVVLTGAFATTSSTIRRTADALTNADVDTYAIRTNQATLGTGSVDYPLPVGGGRVMTGLDAGMVPSSNDVADQLLRQYRLSFRLRGKVDPIFVDVFVHVGAKTYKATSVVRLHLLPPVTGRRSALSIGLELGAIALGVALILALLFIPARWARARFAKEPLRPLLPPGSAVAAPVSAMPSNGAAAAPSGRASPAVPMRITAVRPGPGLGGEQVEGPDAVRELLRARRRQVRVVWMAEDATDPTIEGLASQARVPVRRASRSDIDAASYSTLADGVLAHAAPVVAVDIEDLGGPLGGPMSVIVVDQMADASLGALIRTGVSCGVTGLVLPRRRLSPVSSTVTAVARGAVESLDIVLAPSLPTAVTRLRANGFLAVGIEADAPGRLLDVDLDFARFRVALVIDGTGHLDDLVQARCDLVAGVDRSSGVLESAERIGQEACIELARRRISGAVH